MFKSLVYVLLFAIITAVATGVYLLKKDSASGRLLIWKITLKESLKKPFTGHGFNWIFLLNYGKSLYLSGQYRESLEILERGKDYYTDEVYFTTPGDACKALGKHNQAEKAYKTAANMVPHKFYPLYLLATLYDETGEKAKARQTARNILNKDVKIHSTAIEEIKAEMEELIEK